LADSHSLDALTEALRRLPGVGAKSAARWNKPSSRSKIAASTITSAST
jgi:recombinational DNA repair protein RecR